MGEPRPIDYPSSGRVRRGALYPCGRPGPQPAVVVVHGLGASRTLREIELFCRLLSASFDVVAIDLRGHGDDPDRFTWGVNEHRDLADLIAFLRTLHPSVGVLGFSFGGYVAILSAAMAREDASRPQAICTVGAPAHLRLWRYRISPVGLLSHAWMILRRPRWVRPGWPRLRWMRADEAVAAISPIPLLLVHGGRDWFVHPRHARMLYEAARPPRDLLVLPEGLHAEYIVAQDPRMLLDPVEAFFGSTLGGTATTPQTEVTLSRDRS